MKKRIAWLMAILIVPGMLASASQAHAGAGVSINLPGFGLSVGSGGFGLNIGLPWVVASAPVPAPVPVVVPEDAYPDEGYEAVAVEEAPVFVMPPELGFYVAVGVPYDLFFYNNSYYICRGNLWYSSAYYNGPWTRVYYSNVPYLFNRFPFERVHHFRDTYYGRYQRYGTWEGSRHFRPVRRHDYRATPGRGTYEYASPRNQGPTDRSGSAYRGTSGTRQYRGSSYTDSRPTGRTYGRSPAYTGSYGRSTANSRSAVYYQPHAAAQNHGYQSSAKSPYRSTAQNGNRAAYTRPARNGSVSNNNSYAGQSGSTRQGTGRYAYSQPNNNGKAGAGKTVYYRTTGSRQESTGKGYRHVADSHAGFSRGGQGNPR